MKSSRKPLSKAKPQRSSSFKSQSKSPFKPVIAKSQYNQCLSLLRDALDDYSPRTEATQLEILRNAKEYILHLQQLIHYDDQVNIFVTYDTQVLKLELRWGFALLSGLRDDFTLISDLTACVPVMVDLNTFEGEMKNILTYL